MKKVVTRRDYIYRINRVIDYIIDHLDEKLPVTDLAKIAAFSSSHFHYVFKSMLGESVADYINRLRLEKAASKLLYNPNLSITQISHDCGFSSSAHFANAFKQKYGCSARAFQEKNRKTIISDLDNELIYNVIDESTSSSFFFDSLKIITRQELFIAYSRGTGGYNFKKIFFVLKKMLKWAEPRKHVNDETRFVVIFKNDPSITSEDKCSFDVGISVPASFEAEGEIGLLRIPEGEYATFRVNSDVENYYNLSTTYIFEALNTFLPEIGYEQDDRPFFDTFTSLNESRIGGEIFIPVKPV